MRIRCTNCGIYFFRDSQDEVYTLCDKCLKELIKEGSAPVVPVSASATLSFTGDINQGDTITINGRTYEFDIDGSIRPGNIPIDVTGKAVPAAGTLTATLPVVLGDTVTIGTDTYVIAGDSSNPKNINISGGTKTKATKVFNFTGVASDGETITLGARTYEFDNDSSILPSNVLVDISEGTKFQATTKFSLALPILDGETVSIGDEVYEFDIDGSVASGNKAVDVSDFSTVSQGTITISGTPTDQEKMTIGDVEYTFVTSRSGAGEITIDADNDNQRDNIISAITDDSTDVTAQSGGSGLVTVLAAEDGAAGNLITFTGNVTGLAMDGSGTLGGTQKAIDCDAINAVATLLSTFNANTSYDITGVADGTKAIDFTADAAGALDGSLGNISASTTTDGTISNFSGGADATGKEAAIALVATVAADIIAAPEIVNVTAEAGGDGEFTAKALTAGTVGNAIVIGETTANGTFAGGATLLSGGSDATAAEFIAAIVTTINAITGNIVTAENETGGVMKVTAAVAGAAGNSIVTISNVGGATFGAATLTGGKDAGSTDACAETKATINADTVSVVSAETIDASSIKIVAKTPGDIGNIIKVSTDGDNIAFDKASLSGGVNGTPGWTNQILSDGSKLYISSELSTSTDSNWKEVDINEV